MNEYKSFYKKVDGGEGERCKYPERLDVYGCGYAHNCAYCYAKSLLDFRGLWHPESPSIADIDKVKKRITKINPGSVVRLGGMTDCFQPVEEKEGLMRAVIPELNLHGIGYLIVTKSPLMATDTYTSIMDKNLAHIQISLTCTNDDMYKRIGIEHAPLPSKRIEAIERLHDLGFDTQIRLSPYIPKLINPSVINSIKCDKMLVEFLRVNSYILKQLNGIIDTSAYTKKIGNYMHMPLEEKKRFLNLISSNKRVTVCEDEPEAYEYWKNHYNPNVNDCCDLRC